MKRAHILLGVIAAALAGHAAAVRTATETFVTNRIERAIAAIPAPDFSPSNAALVATIEAKAPPPGNYATVSNRAMSAIQEHQSLQPATNYTDAAITSATNALAQGPIFDNTARLDEMDSITQSLEQIVDRLDEREYITTNAVCAIVTNETARFTPWKAYEDGVLIPHATVEQRNAAEWDPDYYTHGFVYILTSPSVEWWSATEREALDFSATIDGVTYRITRSFFSDNALGLAREKDLAGKQDALPYPTNAIPATAISDLPEGVTPLVVSNIVRTMSLGGIWDENLQVWWTPVMSNGSLTYQATTNVNLNAED